jgi:hypothetical protein
MVASISHIHYISNQKQNLFKQYFCCPQANQWPLNFPFDLTQLHFEILQIKKTGWDNLFTSVKANQLHHLK